MTFNFWGYLLNGVTNIFAWFIQGFPLATPNELIASAPAMIEQVFIQSYFWISPIIDLRFFGIFIGIVLLLEGIYGLISIWRWILSIIPGAA